MQHKEVAAQLRSALAAADELISDSDVAAQIGDSDAMNDTIAMTNATGFVVDEVEVVGARYLGARVLVYVRWAAAGDQEEDKIFCGNVIVGTADVILDDEAPRVIVENIVAEVPYIVSIRKGLDW